MNLDPDRPRSAAEERANVISHAIGLVLAILGTVALVAIPAARGLPERSVTGGIFGLTACATFLTSVAYHSSTTERARQLWLRLDYSAIYLLIAGTYTPLALTLLPPTEGWILFGVEWALALGGILLVFLGREPSTAFYIALGAGGVAVLPALLTGIPVGGLILLGLGGASYIGGTVFYVAQNLRYNHLVWHIAVIFGVGFHYAAVMRYVTLG